MKTEDLIDLLAADTLRVPRHAPARRVTLALAMGTVVSLVLMLVVLGHNPVLGHYLSLPMFWVKFAVPLSMAGFATPLVMRLGRPGVPAGKVWLGWGLPIVGLWLLGLFAWSRAPADLQPALVLGHTWRVCAENIFLLAMPVFVAAIWCLRGLAPVRQARAGAAAGALAGAVGAAVYALHCPELAAPFIAVWYVIGMLAPVALGAALGPRLLRW